MYECEWNNEEKADSKLNPDECAMLNDFEIYIVHAESAETEKRSILSTKVDYGEYNRKVLPSTRVKFKPTEKRCLIDYIQIKDGNRSCQEIDFENMTEQFQVDYLDRYEGVHAEIHQVSQFDESSAVRTTYLSKVNMLRKNAPMAQEHFTLTD